MDGAEQDAELSGDGEKRRVPRMSRTLGGGGWLAGWNGPKMSGGRGEASGAGGEWRLQDAARMKTLPHGSTAARKSAHPCPQSQGTTVSKEPIPRAGHLVRISGQLRLFSLLSVGGRCISLCPSRSSSLLTSDERHYLCFC